MYIYYTMISYFQSKIRLSVNHLKVRCNLLEVSLDKQIVMDETNSSSKYDIKFSFQPENPSSLEKQLFDMGLILEKKQQLVDVLMIYHSK